MGEWVVCVDGGGVEAGAGDAAWVAAGDEVVFGEVVDVLGGLLFDGWGEVEFAGESGEVFAGVDGAGWEAEFAVHGVVGGFEFVG